MRFFFSPPSGPKETSRKWRATRWRMRPDIYTHADRIRPILIHSQWHFLNPHVALVDALKCERHQICWKCFLAIDRWRRVPSSGPVASKLDDFCARVGHWFESCVFCVRFHLPLIDCPLFFLFEISSFDFPPVRFKRKNFGRLTRDPPVHVTPSVSACSNFGEQFTFNFHSFIIDPASISRVWQLTFLNSKKRLWFLQIKQIVPAEAAAVNSIRPIKLETVKLLAGNVSMQLAH